MEILDGTLATGDSKRHPRHAVNIRTSFRIYRQHVLDEGVDFRRILGIVRNAELSALDGEGGFAERQGEETQLVK